MAIRVCVSMCVLPISKFVRLYVRYHGSLVALKKIKMKEKKRKRNARGNFGVPNKFTLVV